MKRRDFLKGMFAVAVATAIAQDLMVRKLVEAPASSVPGMGGTTFTIQVHRNTFHHGDIVYSAKERYIFLKKDSTEGMLKPVNGDGASIRVVFFEDMWRKQEMEKIAREYVRMANAYVYKEQS